MEWSRRRPHASTSNANVRRINSAHRRPRTGLERVSARPAGDGSTPAAGATASRTTSARHADRAPSTP